MSTWTFDLENYRQLTPEERAAARAGLDPEAVETALAGFLASALELTCHQELHPGLPPPTVADGLVLRLTAENPVSAMHYREFQLTLTGRHRDPATLRHWFGQLLGLLPTGGQAEDRRGATLRFLRLWSTGAVTYRYGTEQGQTKLEGQAPLSVRILTVPTAVWR